MAIRVGKTWTRRRAAEEGTLFCSFCGKSQHEVRRLIAGPAVFICGECVGVCDDILAGIASREASEAWTAWQSLTDTDLLATLPGVLRHSDAVRGGLQARVDELRKRDVSWARIGEALGISRQAAWERFA